MATVRDRPSRRTARLPADCLTCREIEVIQAVVDFAGTGAAAHHLGIAESTVKRTLANARAKVGVEATYQLTLVAAPRLRAPRGMRRKFT
jgi:DNA-binding NarL/FixJ family response regulator